MIKECIDLEQLGLSYLKEIKDLINKDIYVSKRKYDEILDKYEYLFKNMEYDNNTFNLVKNITNKIDEIISRHNEKFIEKKLVEYKDYFDHIFDDIDSNIKLDEEQRRAILIDEDYSLVIAGAGSGKTTTMSAKVKYLVEKLNIEPKRIVVMSFTKRATEELQDRINNQFKLNANVTTFHKLGMDILRKKFKHPLKIVTESGKYEILRQFIVENLFINKPLLKHANKIFCNYLSFDNKCLKYKTFDEYYDYYTRKKYKEVKHNLKEFNNQKINDRLKNLISINGEKLKSKEEVKIANFLYESNIPYLYEQTYPHKLENNVSYSPDFTLQNNFKTYYIEYYGLSKYKKNGFFSVDDIAYYNDLIEKKKNIHKMYNTDLIEIYSDEKLLYKLKNELQKRSFIFNDRTDKEIFLRLMETSKTALLNDLINLMIDFITRFKEKNYTLKDIEKLCENAPDDNTKKQVKFMGQVIKYYDKYIHDRYMIDFEDMINYAYRDMFEYKNISKQVDYDYIIVDEYQDVSTQKYNFIKKLSDVFNAKIVAVGDDWQAIFGFSGSDISLFTRFSDMMGYGEIVKITNTYRNSQELIDIAGEFITKNKTQFEKRLFSNKHLDKPIEIAYYNLENKLEKIEVINEIIINIYNSNPKSKILLIGRYNSDIEQIIESKYFDIKSHGKIVCLEQKNADITFLTAHSSKGLGFDEVIIINALDGIYGFPSKKETEPLLRVFNDKTYDEKILYPEERRLFYVALTRTKNKVYIVCPNEKQSEFILEIKQNKNVTEKFYRL